MSCLVGTSTISTILEVDAVTPVNIYYLPAEYSLDRCFQFLIPSWDDWHPSTVVPLEVLYIYTDGCKLTIIEFVSNVYSKKLKLNISLRLLTIAAYFKRR